MNPWTIVSWISAISVAMFIIAIPASILVNVIRSAFKPKISTIGVTSVFTGK